MAEPSLLTFLDQVRTRPGMYLNADDVERGLQLDHLETLIAGYRAAVLFHDLDDPGVRLYEQFPNYVGRKFRGTSCIGPIRAIRQASLSDEEAWITFWSLLRQFLDTR